MIGPRAIFYVFAALCLYSACAIYGYHHTDELGQITMFALYKLGLATAAELPWEFAERMRPWLQPALYAAVLERLGAYHHLRAERAMLLLQWVMLLMALPLFSRALRVVRDGDRDLRRAHGVLALGFCWFVPSMLVRHSSEAFATLLLMMGLGLWASVEQRLAKCGKVALFSGLCVGLACASRYQLVMFAAGFGVARLCVASLRQEKVALGLALCGALVAQGIALVVDTYGYGVLTFAPWSYFRQNVLLDRASNFGREPFYFYFVEASLVTLNPALFVWLVRAAVRARRQPFTRALAVGFAAFFLGHLIIPHKELRFLLPMWPVALLLLASLFLARDDDEAACASRLGRAFGALFAPRYAKVVLALNLVVLVGFTAFGLVRDRYRVDLMLSALPSGAVVFTPANLYGRFDAAHGTPPRPKYYTQAIRKPPHVRLVYAEAHKLGALCREQPAALVLLSNKEVDAEAASLLGRMYRETYAAAPWWWSLVPASWSRRSWRFVMVPCSEF